MRRIPDRIHMITSDAQDIEQDEDFLTKEKRREKKDKAGFARRSLAQKNILFILENPDILSSIMYIQSNI